VKRRLKQSPLQDVAAMLRSLHYAAVAVSYGVTRARAGNVEDEVAAARAWRMRASDAFVDGYRQTIDDSERSFAETGNANALLELLVLTQALGEIPRELAHRPEWLRIPVEGCLEILGHA
jgi:maltose alpha-D-glucosyltransferase/alpha-amylase